MKNIVIVDDDVDVQEFLSLCFMDEDYHITSVLTPEKLSLDKHDLPDLIIMDYSLPIDNGANITKQIKKSPQTRHIPILMISADSSVEDTSKGAGADAFLPKPLDVEVLLETVSELVN